MNKITILSMTCFCLMLTFSCESGGAKKAGKKINPTGNAYEHVDLNTFLSLLEDKNNILIDVRTLGEFSHGHIEGARLISVGKPNFVNKIQQLDTNKTYLICADAGPRSTSAMSQMRAVGIKRLFNLRRGIKAWREAGQKEVKK